MFPTMDPEFVRNVLRNMNNVYEEAKESLSSISFNGESIGSWRDEEMTDGTKWVDRLVSEMLKAIKIDDMRQRVVVILEALERTIKHNSDASKKMELSPRRRIGQSFSL